MHSTTETESLKTPLLPGKILVIGWGMIAKACMLAVLKNFNIQRQFVTIITADYQGVDVATKEGFKHIVQPLNPSNYKQLLSPLLHTKDLILNLSVDVSSVALIELAQEMGCFYLDTCIEPWAGCYDNPNLPLAARTNYMLREEALSLQCKYPRGLSPTAVLACGANPGMVSFLLKEALVQLASDINLSISVPTCQTEWAQLAQKLNIKVIHIAERDTQVPKLQKQRGEFVNTWSVDGFVSEGIFQPAEMGWGTHEKELPPDAMEHTEGCKAALFLTKPGGSVTVRSWTPDEGPYHGFLITHNENISIANYLTLYDTQGKVVYRPTVHYVYHPCDAAVLSILETIGKEAQIQKNKRILGPNDIATGMDELGVLLCGHTKGAYWYGSQLTIEEAKAVLPYNNATSLQVVAGVLAGILHCVEYPNEGIIETEDLDYTKSMAIARPYLGKVGGFYTDWTPLTNHNVLFPTVEKLDVHDPWQWGNFRVS